MNLGELDEHLKPYEHRGYRTVYLKMPDGELRPLEVEHVKEDADGDILISVWGEES